MPVHPLQRLLQDFDLLARILLLVRRFQRDTGKDALLVLAVGFVAPRSRFHHLQILVVVLAVPPTCEKRYGRC